MNRVVMATRADVSGKYVGTDYKDMAEGYPKVTQQG